MDDFSSTKEVITFCLAYSSICSNTKGFIFEKNNRFEANLLASLLLFSHSESTVATIIALLASADSADFRVRAALPLQRNIIALCLNCNDSPAKVSCAALAGTIIFSIRLR